MARNEKPSGKGKIKFRFIDFEMDGGDATLQDAIREITRAIGKPAVIKVAPALAAAGGAQNPQADDVEDEVDEDNDSSNDDESGGSDDAAKDKPKRYYKSPTVLDIDLKSENPLRPFLESLAPDSDAKRYMAIAYWFKTYRATSEVTPDHIYTGYKAMNWTTIPKDVGGPLRSLKKEGLFRKGTGKYTYTLNHIGDSRVEEMINKATPAT
jgi:hypothetical protein